MLKVTCLQKLYACCFVLNVCINFGGVHVISLLHKMVYYVCNFLMLLAQTVLKYMFKLYK